LVGATVREETEFLSKHLAKWLSIFKTYAGDDPPVAGRAFPPIRKDDPYYALVVLIDKFVQDDKNWLTKLQPCIPTPLPRGCLVATATYGLNSRLKFSF